MVMVGSKVHLGATVRTELVPFTFMVVVLRWTSGSRPVGASSRSAAGCLHRKYPLAKVTLPVNRLWFGDWTGPGGPKLSQV